MGNTPTLALLKREYASLSFMSPEELTVDSPLKAGEFTNDVTPQKFFNLNRN